MGFRADRSFYGVGLSWLSGDMLGNGRSAKKAHVIDSKYRETLNQDTIIDMHAVPVRRICFCCVLLASLPPFLRGSPLLRGSTIVSSHNGGCEVSGGNSNRCRNNSHRRSPLYWVYVMSRFSGIWRHG